MSYQELFRLTSQRSANKVSRSNFNRIGIPAYPDWVYSNLVERIKRAKCDKEKITTILSEFYSELAEITDGYLSYFPQDIQDGYNYLELRDFSIRKSSLEEFKKICQIKERETSKLKEYQSFAADTLCARVISAEARDAENVDEQGLIRFLHFLEIIYGDTVNLDEVSVEQVNAFLNAPIILPPEIVSHRCCCSHDEERIVRNKGKQDRPPLPGIGNGHEQEEDHTEDCNCEKDNGCKDPSKHCICIRPYVTDLLVVKEKLDRYETGDIAYIENVMSGEKRIRNHRNLTRSEDYSETETETTKYEENDHQVTDKSSLQSEVSRTVQSDLSIDAGVTYNNTFGFGEITATANVASNTSRSTSNRIARTKARDVVNRSITKLEERVRELRSKRVIKEIEESNKHVFQNITGTDHINGFYYWVNKVSKSQVYNRGMYMMFDQVLTTPAAMYKELMQKKENQSIYLTKPTVPKYKNKPLTLDAITENNFLDVVSENPVDGITAPIAKEVYVNVPLTLSLPSSARDGVTTSGLTEKISIDYIPKGYLAQSADLHGKVSSSHPYYINDNKDEVNYSITVGDYTTHEVWSDRSNGAFSERAWDISKSNIDLGGSSVVAASIAIYGTMVVNVAVNLKIKCVRKDSVLDEWKLSVFNTIMEDYNSKLQAYNDALQNQKTEKIKGRNPFLNREIERNELKRQVIAMLMCDYFNDNKALMHNVKPCGYPEPDFKRLEIEGKIIQFFEQVFEWKLMNYIFYSDMWADKCTWADLIDQDSGDPLFDKFLQAGAAKVQVPIRDGMGEVFNWFLITGQIWGQSGNPPMIGDENYVSIIQEIKEDKQCQYTDRPGVIDFGATPTATKELILIDSTYYWSFLANNVNEGLIENDIDREIVINCKVYKIISIEQLTSGDYTRWKINVDRVVEPGDIQFHKHSVGAKCIGAPWEVMYGTNLVYLKDGESL